MLQNYVYIEKLRAYSEYRIYFVTKICIKGSRASKSLQRLDLLNSHQGRAQIYSK
jgi:hypothetical protein